MSFEWLQACYFFLPAGIANMAPIIATRIFGKGRPIDGGRRWRGKPILGSHKTWQGLISGTIAGGIFYILQIYLTPVAFNVFFGPWWLGFIMGFGALFGDGLKSFFKRRLDIRPGKPWIPFDQIDYPLGALLLVSLAVQVPWSWWLYVIVVYGVLQVLVSLMGYWLGVRTERI